MHRTPDRTHSGVPTIGCDVEALPGGDVQLAIIRPVDGVDAGLFRKAWQLHVHETFVHQPMQSVHGGSSEQVAFRILAQAGDEERWQTLFASEALHATTIETRHPATLRAEPQEPIAAAVDTTDDA